MVAVVTEIACLFNEEARDDAGDSGSICPYRMLSPQSNKMLLVRVLR